MDPDDFIAKLSRLTADDLTAIAAQLRNGLATSDGEVAWWRATMAVDGCLRLHRLSRRAGLVAHDAVLAVRAAADAAELVPDDVTVVARAGAETARALVAERHGSLPDRLVGLLLAPWSPRLALAA